MADTLLSTDPAIVCAECGTSIAAALLACPSCRRLVHADRLAALAHDAEAAAARHEPETAAAMWHEALALLPPGSRQHDLITARLAQDERDREGGGETRHDARRGTPWSWIGVSAVAAFILTKGKFLLLGLTKSTTLLSMLASFGVYWTQWGMLFALGFVGSIYVHEMGHVAALRRYGIPASAPMFIPGLGAFVRMHHAPKTVAQDARVGLAGPVWGLGAAVASWLLFLITGQPLWAAIARTGAWINLFNLLPVWQLDGGRAFAALSTSQRWLAAVAVAIVWRVSGEGLLVLLLIGVAARAAFDRTAPQEDDRGALALYIALVATLAWLTLVRASVQGA